jgi:hypothetical protein
MYVTGFQLELDDSKFTSMEPQGFNVIKPVSTLPMVGHPMRGEPKLVWMLSFRIFHPTLFVTGNRD